jgi:hypothetical protein
MDSTIQNLKALEEDLRKLRQLEESNSNQPTIPNETPSEW